MRVRRRAPPARPVCRGPDGARPLRRALQKYIEDPLADAIIQGSIQRPAELEIYLGDTGIFCRPVREDGEEGVPVGAPEEPGTPLYTF